MNKFITLLHLIDWHWMLTAILGIYGAALTTYSISSARKQNRRQVKVTVNYGYLTYAVRLVMNRCSFSQLPIPVNVQSL